VYWIDQSTTVWKAPKTGGAPTPVLTTLNNSNQTLVGGPNGIFVLDRTTPRAGIIYSVLGNWTRPIPDPSGVALASDGANVYFHPGPAPTASLSWLDGATGVVSGRFTDASNGGFINANAAVTTANSCGVFYTDGQKLGLLSRGARGSGSTTTLFSGAVGAATSDGNAIYFFANNSIGKLPMP
ncbi:MAG: hypothetical protein M3N13_03975, partial [Candidatus Eremiobacteraeota bacterium]|nr:hypothetical protein [Candidatus Eremiobacteraeota bacterium]